MPSVIVGGGGFIGAHLASRLCADREVRVLSRGFRIASAPTHHPNIQRIKGDFLHRQLMKEILTGADTVYHLASTTIPQTANQDPIYDISSNAMGTMQLLQLCAEHGVRKIVFMSSGGTVYGHPRTLPLTEDHPTDPISAYGITKLAIEKYLHLFQATHQLDYRILRLSNPYGPQQLPTTRQGVIAAFLKLALRNESIRIWGDGSVVRDYIYIDDVIDAILAVSTLDSTSKLFNVGSGIGRSLNEIIGVISKILGRQLKISYEENRSFDVSANILCIKKVQAEFGWKPAIDLEDGIQRTALWMSDHLHVC